MIKIYTISKGTNDGNLAFAWQLSCNGKHVQWFSDESIARKTCDELTSIELIKENTKAETVTEFADRCRECGREKVLDKIRAEIAEYGSIRVEYKITGNSNRDIEKLVGDVLSQAKKQVLDVIDKYKAESEK